MQTMANPGRAVTAKSMETLRRFAFVSRSHHLYVRRLARGVSRFATPKRGCVVREFTAAGDASELPPAIRAWRPDAVISFLDRGDSQRLDEMVGPSVPVVNASRTQPQENRAVVLGSAPEFYELAHEHFAELGVKSVCQFNVGDPVDIAPLEADYRWFAVEKQIPCHTFAAAEPASLDAIGGMSDFDDRMVDWLRTVPKPIGVFSQQTFCGQMLARACEVLGISVPDEVAIIGCDSFEVANSSTPPVTTFHVPAEQVGYNAAKVASLMLEDHQAPRELLRVGGGQLILRESTRRPQVTMGCDIDAALAFIAEHACSGVKVQDVMAHTQQVSRVTFHKRFLERTGVTPATLIQDHKIGEAKRLLAETAMSPGAIAAICGYLDYNHFYRVFRRQEGISPKAYRDQAV